MNTCFRIVDKIIRLTIWMPRGAQALNAPAGVDENYHKSLFERSGPVKSATKAK
jgi:hypothetical protein